MITSWYTLPDRMDKMSIEDAVKLILFQMIGTSIPTGGGITTSTGSGLPYGADEQVITNVTAGPSVIVYKLASATLKTRTFTYSDPNSASGQITHTVDT